jgi:hypothetical protein
VGAEFGQTEKGQSVGQVAKSERFEVPSPQRLLTEYVYWIDGEKTVTTKFVEIGSALS